MELKHLLFLYISVLVVFAKDDEKVMQGKYRRFPRAIKIERYFGRCKPNYHSLFDWQQLARRKNYFSLFIVYIIAKTIYYLAKMIASATVKITLGIYKHFEAKVDNYCLYYATEIMKIWSYKKRS